MKYFGYKENIGYGFYDKNFEGAVSLTDTEWQNLLSQQSKNKQIVMFDGKIFATDSNLYFLNSEGKYEKYTDEELKEQQEIKQVVQITNQSLQFLDDTDWKVTRHRDQLALGIETSLTNEEYLNLLTQRQEARDLVIRGEKYGNIE